MIMDFCEFWALMNSRKKRAGKIEKDLLFFTKLNNIITDILPMITIENLPDSTPETFVKTVLLYNGSIGVYKENDRIIFAQGGDEGDIDIYGYGKNYLCQTINGDDSKVIEKGVDGIVIYNNCNRSPDFNIFQFARQYTELELSENRNVLFSRIMPMPYVDDSKQEEQVKNAVENLLNGEFVTIKSSNANKDIFGNNLPQREPLNLSDVRNIPYLQYLTEYHDTLDRRFYRRYGQSLQTTAKHAQVSKEEITGQNSISWIVPLDMLNEWKYGFEHVNKMFGTNISVHFSELWQREYERFMTENNNNENSVDRISKDEKGDNDNAEDSTT